MNKDIVNVKDRILDEQFLLLLSPSIFDPTPERLKDRAINYKSKENVYIYAYCENDQYLGIVVFETNGDCATILDIAVAAKCRNKGVGSCLVDFIFNEFAVVCVYAETDDDAVGFYIKYGFVILNTYIKYDITRYQLVCDRTRFSK